MQDNFLKFKKRIQSIALIKCAILSVSSAIFVVGLLLLLAKVIEFSPLYCLVGLVLLPLIFVVTFLLLKADDITVAKVLDGTFGLNEKTQTMVEFACDDNVFAAIQREDTQRALSQCSPKAIKFKNLWFYIVVGVLALAMLIVSLALPTKTQQPIIEQQPQIWQPTEWTWQALDELIDEVRVSVADEVVFKPRTLSSLNALRTLLKGGVEQKNLALFVEVTISEINVALVDANAQSGISEQQQQDNESIRDYVNGKLYEIFGLKKANDDGDKPPADDDKESGEQGGTGTGDISMGADDTFFHPVLGYVKYKDIIGEYYDTLTKAFQEGVISEEQWYDYMMLYFRYLYGTLGIN